MNNLTFLNFWLIFLSILVLGCKDAQPVSPETTTALVPGELEVQFLDRVDIAEAEAFLQELSLRPIKLSNLEDQTVTNWTVVGVPEGLERYWIKHLLHYPIVISANQKSKTIKIE